MNKNEINMQNEKLYTALIIIARNFKMYRQDFAMNILKTLIDFGADLNIKNNEGWTALMFVCCNSDSNFTENMLKMLLDSKVDINIQNTRGNTALMIASRVSCMHPTENTVKMLLAVKAEVNIKNDEGWTALMSASSYVNTQSTENVIRLLLNAKADVDIKSKEGETASNIYIRNNKQHLDDEVLILLGKTKGIPFNSLAFNTMYTFHEKQNELCSICLKDIKSIPRENVVIISCGHFLCKACAARVSICLSCGYII